MAILKTTLNTIKNKVAAANGYEAAITVNSNTYLGIGRVVPWDLNTIPESVESTEGMNQVFRGLVAIKKINSSDVNLVVPRIDWLSGSVYSEYTENLELFTYDTLTQIEGTVSAESSNANVVGVDTFFTSNVSVGDFIVMYGDGNTSPEVTKEVVSIANDTTLRVNSPYSATYSGNVAYKVANSYPRYANDFYVKNSRDQIFKCLYNNFGAQSTVMPEINISGDLPENPYIVTSDNYKWKYMYTIPSGLKEKFMTRDWMPVVTDTIVYEHAVNGRLDIFEVIDGGDGYLGGTSNISSPIIQVRGDGTGANLTAKVVNGVITDILPYAGSVTNRGSNYTFANITVNDPSQNVGGNTANIIAVISPKDGHGSNPYFGLGAKNLMISVQLESDEGGVIPVSSGSDSFDYHQIAILQNPKSNNAAIPYLNGTRYKTVHVVKTTTGAVDSFALDEIAFQGISYETSTFYGTVVKWDSANSELWLNNVVGTPIINSPILGTVSGITALTMTSITEPEYSPFTGDILYVENRPPIARDPYQTEQIKLVLSF